MKLFIKYLHNIKAKLLKNIFKNTDDFLISPLWLPRVEYISQHLTTGNGCRSVYRIHNSQSYCVLFLHQNCVYILDEIILTLSLSQCL